MKRFARTRSEKRASQSAAGRAQWSVGSIDDEGIRYGLTTNALIRRTIAIAPAMVTAQSTIVRHGCGRRRARRSIGLREWWTGPWYVSASGSPSRSNVGSTTEGAGGEGASTSGHSGRAISPADTTAEPNQRMSSSPKTLRRSPRKRRTISVDKTAGGVPNSSAVPPWTMNAYARYLPTSTPSAAVKIAITWRPNVFFFPPTWTQTRPARMPTAHARKPNSRPVHFATNPHATPPRTAAPIPATSAARWRVF